MCGDAVRRAVRSTRPGREAIRLLIAGRWQDSKAESFALWMDDSHSEPFVHKKF